MFLPSALRKASITSLPLARVKSPLCDLMIFIPGFLAMTSPNPFLRSLAGGPPVGPFHSTMLPLPSNFFRKPFARHAALSNEIRGNQSGIEGVIGNFDPAVDEDDRNSGAFDFAEDRFPPGLNDWREDNGIDPLGEKRAQSFDLIFLFLLRVGETQIDSAFFGFGLNGFGFGGAPAAFRANLAEADHELFGGGVIG